LALCLLMLSFAGPAVAHSEAVLVEPTDGSRMDALPAQVAVRTADRLTSAAMVLTRPGGRIEKLKVAVNGHEAAAALPTDGPRGEYKLAYRVVAEDGHAVTGAVDFTVRKGAPPDLNGTSEPKPAGGGFPILGVVGGAMALVFVGVTLVLVKVRR
jgi:hypothetical protein